MNLATIYPSINKAFLSGIKTLFILKPSKYLVGKLQGISADRKQLWRVYDDSAYTYNMPKCIWRRHAAVLIYARSNKSELDKPVRLKHK